VKQILKQEYTVAFKEQAVKHTQTTGSVAEALGVSVTTIRTHLARIFQKTGCTSQRELVKLIWELSLPVVR
jgi:DNA-binding CsgD family transcriptional regulator